MRAYPEFSTTYPFHTVYQGGSWHVENLVTDERFEDHCTAAAAAVQAKRLKTETGQQS